MERRREWQRWARSRSTSAGFLLLAALAALPLWLAERPPIQDWPQHLAAVRVLHDYHRPELGFEHLFVLDVGSTQYLTVYYLAHALAYAVGVTSALKLVASLAIVALPASIAVFARALGRAPSAGLLALPLTYNAHLILGFLNFVLALPLMFLALALAAEERTAPRAFRPWLTGAVLVACFYTHVVPFAVGGCGAALLAFGGPWRATLLRLLPLALSALATIPWLLFSPAGTTLRGAAGLAAGDGAEPHYLPWRESYEQIPRWLTEVWKGDWDQRCLVAWGALVVTWIVLGVWAWVRKGAGVRPRSVALWLLPLACGIAYFLAPNGYRWIWPINTRFLLMALLLVLPLVFSPPPQARTLVSLLSALLTALVVGHVSARVIAFEREMGDLDGALARIPPGSRVAGLIWDRGSRVVEFSPFLHSVAYYQAARGGAVMFTFADFPQSPFRFREGDRPPRVRPRWEWLPERVSPDRDLDWYDWVLTRGGPGRMARSREFELVWEKRPWRVWSRRD